MILHDDNDGNENALNTNLKKHRSVNLTDDHIKVAY